MAALALTAAVLQAKYDALRRCYVRELVDDFLAAGSRVLQHCPTATTTLPRHELLSTASAS